MKRQQKAWVYKPSAPKFTATEKEQIKSKVKTIIKTMPKLSQKVSRIDMKGNRIYLYELVEQVITDGAKYIVPLIDGKYLEFPYARVTLKDTGATICTADWQRHNNQWLTLFTGTLEECLNGIENDDSLF